MGASYVELGKCGFPYFVEDFLRHFLIGRVIDSGHGFSIHFVGPNLPQENTVGTNFGLALMIRYRIGYFFGRNCSLYKYFFGFFLSINYCFYSAFHIFEVVKAKFIFKDFNCVFASFS